MSIKNDKYYDVLHVDSTRLVVSYKGQDALILNKRLLDKQNCWENVEKIKDAHIQKLHIYDEINETEDRAKLKELGKKLQEIEFKLQGYWKFELDARFHRFWEYPKCTCPKMDNADSYPHRHHVSLNCPLHGDSSDTFVE